MNKWDGLVRLCTESPSGLAWDFNLYITDSRFHPKVKVGKFAGSLDDKGRWSFMYEGKNYYCHRVIYGLLYNCELPDDLVVDHLDGNPSNNSGDNLEVKTGPQNSRNRHKSKYNTSGNTGVYFATKKSKTVVIAKCRTLEGKPNTRIFSVDKFGIMLAYKLAVEHRAKMIEKLNLQGAMYTERHGKESND